MNLIPAFYCFFINGVALYGLNFYLVIDYSIFSS